MYDYTFTIPHGIFCLTGGIVGLIRSDDRVFAVPLILGPILIAIAVRSLKRFFRGKLSPDGVIVSLLLGAGNAALMHQAYQKTGLFHPAGLLRIVSSFMVVYYIWNLLFGPPPLDPPPPYNPPAAKKRS